jgi:hypothetical protein
MAAVNSPPTFLRAFLERFSALVHAASPVFDHAFATPLAALVTVFNPFLKTPTRAENRRRGAVDAPTTPIATNTKSVTRVTVAGVVDPRPRATSGVDSSSSPSPRRRGPRRRAISANRVASRNREGVVERREPARSDWIYARRARV